MRDAIVIGNGVVGASIAGMFRLQGRDTLVLDSHRPLSGTGPCGGSVKPSPLTGLPKDEEKPMLDTLDTLFGLTKETFQIHPSGDILKRDVWRIGMDRVYGSPHEEVDDSWIRERTGFPTVHYIKHGIEIMETCRLLVVAAGMGTMRLIPEIQLTAKHGVSFRFSGQVEHPFVQTWAPYKQVTVHNITPTEIWAADGSALKPENWTDERTIQSKLRIQAAMGRTDGPTQIREGLRSFDLSGRKPCLLAQVNERIWVAVGAGKFGCIAAGWAANEMSHIGAQ
jgi:hypothetical protein